MKETVIICTTGTNIHIKQYTSEIPNALQQCSYYYLSIILLRFSSVYMYMTNDFEKLYSLHLVNVAQ